MPRKKSDIKSPKDLIPDPADLENDEMVAEVDDVDIAPEDVAELEVDDTLDLSHPALAEELSEDPVRLYLREIGQVKLLDADSEFRLSTQIEAYRLIKVLSHRVDRHGVDHLTTVYRAVIDEMLVAWRRLDEDSTRLEVHIPDMAQRLGRGQHQRHIRDMDYQAG